MRDKMVEKKKAVKEKVKAKKVKKKKVTEKKKEKVVEKPKKEKPKEETSREEKPKEEVPREEKEIKKVVEEIKFYGRKVLSKEEKRLFKLAKGKKTPRFIRQELTKLKKLKDVWRAPKGVDSKQQEEKRGKGRIPKIGYKKPKKVQNLDPSGYYPILVHNLLELRGVNSKKEAIIISGSVGRRKRNEIIKSANKSEIAILNPRKGEIKK